VEEYVYGMREKLSTQLSSWVTPQVPFLEKFTL